MLALRYIIAILGFLIGTMMLWDAFEVIILPQHVTRRFRFARFFYVSLGGCGRRPRNGSAIISDARLV